MKADKKMTNVAQGKSNVLQKTKDDERLRAAFALNMCMVSLSQIVDYADTNVMRQEYDAILNNLNMENIIKDESMLVALRQILDTCHFYLLHAKDKDILKKRQAARIKSALGKALGGGNVFALFGTPNPWALAAGVGALVGVAAIKYKSERQKAILENEIEEWELDKTALEQLHNLRRQLFETAWRLSDAYGFPDEYRLTETTIKIYDDILADPVPVNRYERLALIEDWFKAYPLFHYYKARAALEASYEGREVGDGQKEIAYAQKAADSLKVFFEMKSFNNLLREDLLSAAAYLDFAALCKTRAKMLVAVDNARKIAGLDCEVIQNCAFRYLLLLDGSANIDGALSKAEVASCQKSAEWCLKLLMSENYNAELNGHALSRLYKDLKDKTSYTILRSVVAARHGFAFKWIEPWDEHDAAQEWSSYCAGDVRNVIAAYLDGRTRLVLGDFFRAVRADCASGNWNELLALKKKAWPEKAKVHSSKGVEADLESALLMNYHDPVNNDGDQSYAKYLVAGAAAGALLTLPFGGGLGLALRLGLIGKDVLFTGGAWAAAMAGYSAAGTLGAIGSLAYKMCRDKMYDYAFIDPDAGSYVASVLNNCVSRLAGYETRGDFNMVKKSLDNLVDAMKKVIDESSKTQACTLWLYNHDPDAPLSQGAEQLLKVEERLCEFVATAADAISKVLDEVVSPSNDDVRFLMGCTMSQKLPDSLRLAYGLEQQGDIMRMRAASEGFVDAHRALPQYFTKIKPLGEGVKSISIDGLYD